MGDWFDDALAVQWAQHVLDDMVPKMEESAVVISLVPRHGIGDVKYWVELGAALCMDKPLILTVLGEVEQIPERLRRVADEIVFLPEGASPESATQLTEAILRVQGRSG